MGFAKVDDEFAGSSLLVQGGLELAGLWLVLLSKKGRDGRIYDSLPMLARICGATVAKIEALLAILAAPDPYSRTPDNEGRRIRIEREPRFCIVILNHAKYMERDDNTAADRMRRFRERQRAAASVTPVTPVTEGVTPFLSTSTSERNGEGGVGEGPRRITGEDRVEYGKAVWETFTKRAGTQRGGSSAEWNLLSKWMDRGLPLAIVLRGIEETGGTPRTLHACERAVESAVEYWRQAAGLTA